jgi:hypothetical protein
LTVRQLHDTSCRECLVCHRRCRRHRRKGTGDAVLDKVRQHKCDCFLLATTTTASTGLKELLDKLDSSEGGSVQTKVWDRFEITRVLLSDECTDLLVQFFPDYARKEAVARLEAAREVVEAHLPRFVVGQLRAHLVPKKDREALLSGDAVWPHDADQLAIINGLTAGLMKSWWRKDRFHRVVKEAEGLHFDAFISFCDALIRNFPKIAVDFLKAVASPVGMGSGVSASLEQLTTTLGMFCPFELNRLRSSI